MFFRCVGAFALVAAIAAPAAAQDEKVEASFLVGYTASDGINAANTRIIQGKPYNEVAPVSGGSWGFTFGVFVNPHAEVEFLYSRQSSQLQAGGTVGTLKLSDLAVTDIDVNFVYNWGARRRDDPAVRLRRPWRDALHSRHSGDRGSAGRCADQHRQHVKVCVHVGRRREDLSDTEGRLQGAGASDANLHPVECDRRLVRPVLRCVLGRGRRPGTRTSSSSRAA